MWLIIKTLAFIAQRTFDKNDEAETGDIFLNFQILRLKLLYHIAVIKNPGKINTNEKKLRRFKKITKKRRATHNPHAYCIYSLFISFKTVILRAV